jgi:hypothetical protein
MIFHLTRCAVSVPPAQVREQPRRAPDHRLRGAGSQPLDRAPDRLVNPQIRQDRPPLPHHRDPGRARPITAADPVPDELRQALEVINSTR